MFCGLIFEYLYVMGILFFYGLLAGIIAGVVIEHFVFRKDSPTDDSEKIQATTEKIDLIIQDIKKTV